MNEANVDAQPLFIFGFQRSGTTLLQRILNSYDDVLIWGEHVGFLRDIANAYFRVWRNPDFFDSTVALDRVLRDSASLTEWQAWMNWVEEDDWTELYRRFVESVFAPEGLPGKRFWGWKEVHYTGMDHELTLPFLAAIYPRARYVFLVRDGFNNLASFSIMPSRQSVAAWKHLGCDRWRDTLSSFRQWHQSDRVASFWVRYEDMIEEKGEILRLLQHMGKQFGDGQRAILRAETARASSFGTGAFNDRWMQLSAFRRGVAEACIGKLNRSLGYPSPPVPLLARIAGRAAAPFLSLAHLASHVPARIRSAFQAGKGAAPGRGR